MTDWYSASGQARLMAAWPGAPIENEELLGMVLDTARLQVVTYAGIEDTEDAPYNLVYAQLQQAKNLWAAGRASQDGEIGSEGFSFVPRPLDKTIRSIIRPVNPVVTGGL